MIAVGLGCVACAAVLWTISGSTEVAAQEEPDAPKAEGDKSDRAAGQALADEHMQQWKRKNPARVADWVAEEKERHAIQPPADNSHLLKGDQGKGHTYCFECAEFPCGAVESFASDGWAHHGQTVENMKQMREIGLREWLARQQEAVFCPGMTR